MVKIKVKHKFRKKRSKWIFQKAHLSMPKMVTTGLSKEFSDFIYRYATIKGENFSLKV